MRDVVTNDQQHRDMGKSKPLTLTLDFGGKEPPQSRPPWKRLMQNSHDCWRHWPRLRRMSGQMMGRLIYL
jgi:hypothetical protein